MSGHGGSTIGGGATTGGSGNSGGTGADFVGGGIKDLGCFFLGAFAGEAQGASHLGFASWLEGSCCSPQAKPTDANSRQIFMVSSPSPLEPPKDGHTENRDERQTPDCIRQPQSPFKSPSSL